MDTTFFSYFRRALSPLLLVKGRVFMQSCYLLLQFTGWMVGAAVLADITNLAIAKASWTELWHAAIPMVSIITVMLIFLGFHVRYSTSQTIRVKIMAFLDVQILGQLLRGNDSALAHSGIGKRLTILQHGVADWSTFVITFMGGPACNGVFFLAIMVYIGIRTPSIVPAAILYVLFTGLLVVLNQRAIRPIRDHRRKLTEDFNRRFARCVMEKPTVVFSGAIDHELEYIYDQGQKIVSDTTKLERKSAVAFWGTRYLLDIARLFATLWIGYDIVQGSATAGDILAMGLLFGLLSGAFQQILDGYQTLSELTVSMERLWGFMDALPKMERLSQGATFIPKK